MILIFHFFPDTWNSKIVIYLTDYESTENNESGFFNKMISTSYLNKLIVSNFYSFGLFLGLSLALLVGYDLAKDKQNYILVKENNCVILAESKNQFFCNKLEEKNITSETFILNKSDVKKFTNLKINKK